MSKKLEADTPWWEVLELPAYREYFDTTWANAGLAVKALNGGPAFSEKHHKASIKEDDNYDAWVERFEKKFPSLHMVQSDRALYKGHASGAIYASPTTMIRVWFNGDSAFENTIVTNDEAFLKEVMNFLNENTTKTLPKGRVYVLVSTQDGPQFRSMGVGGQVLERANYDDEVLKGYDRIIKDLQSAEPAGRVAILDGKPGTGKTFIIRGLLAEIRDVVMVVIPAGLVAKLADPGTLPALIDLHAERGGKPIVFLIEDADECLAPRMADNASAVSTILNLGDGILGKLLDIRVVATTNAKVQEIDDAIMRPGRLSANVAVGPLKAAKAREVYTRLTGKPADGIKESMTLAEVYQQARGDGWEPPKHKKGAMGFNSGKVLEETPPDDDDILPELSDELD